MEIPDDINIGNGATRMGGKHKKEPILRAFNSPEEMAANAEQAYAIGKQRENKQELDAGFDVRDRESVMAFDLGYCMRGGGLILKEIPKDIIPEEKGITLIELGDETIRYWVVGIGPLNGDLRKGDIVHVKPDAQGVKRRLKKIVFFETDGYAVSGVFTSEDEMKRRIEEHDARVKASRI